jgi:NAD+ synthase (glutamine-hydrolysing)
MHSWEVLAELLKSDVCKDIVVDVGMSVNVDRSLFLRETDHFIDRPVMHKNVNYNCRVIFYNQKIHLIRPKLFLANDGNYREMRFFTPWMRRKQVEDFRLPECVKAVAGQEIAVFGDGVVEFNE